MVQCPFCDLDPARTTVVEASPLGMVILSNPRLTPGHLLVIPKRHVEVLGQLSPEEIDDLVRLVTAFQQRIIDRAAEGCDLRQHYRPFQQQDTLKVDHLHIHLLPRGFRDELYERVGIVEEKLFCEATPLERQRFHALYTSR